MASSTCDAAIRKIAWIEPSRLPWGYNDQNIYSGILFPRGGSKMAALLRQLGYEVEVISGELSPIVPEEIARSFDLACVSVLSNTAPHGYVLARELSQLGLPVAMGGYQFAHQGVEPHCFATTEEALGFAPYVVRGEGYAALPALLEAFAGQRPFDEVGGLSYRWADGTICHNPPAALLGRDEICSLPPADWTAIRRVEAIRIAAVHGMHGCPRSCTWCAVWPRDGRRNRNNTSTAFVDELEAVLATGDYLHLFFSADNFPVYTNWALEVCQEMVARGIKTTWTCQAEVGAARNHELLDAMYAAGCRRWCLGLESINPASLKDSNKRQTAGTMEQCVRTLHDWGIQVHGMFIVGLPHDTPETVRATVDWAKQVGVDTCQFLCLADLPGSLDYEAGVREQSFRPFKGAYEPLNWLFLNGHYARLANDAMDLERVQNSYRESMGSFYSLGRSLGPIFSINGPAMRAARRRGETWWRSVREGWLYDTFVAALRLRGWSGSLNWLRGPLNRLYMRRLTAEGPEVAALDEQMLATLPAKWLQTFEEVYAERLKAGTPRIIRPAEGAFLPSPWPPRPLVLSTAEVA